jgi:hypothetical protein
MEKRKSPKGFLVVLPGEIIEIPQDSDKSWLTLFYSLPRELAEKWKPAYDLPCCPYEVLRTDKYDHIVCDDMFKLLVWDCYAWSAWQFFQVKDRKGTYRDIPVHGRSTLDISPCGVLSYSIIPYIRMKFEQNGLGFQNLYNIPQSVEVPWLTYQQFSNLISNVTDMVVVEQEWQPVIDAIWENRTVEDYETTNSTVKTDFMRKWHHNRSGKSISLDEMMESEDGTFSMWQTPAVILRTPSFPKCRSPPLRKKRLPRKTGRYYSCVWTPTPSRKSQTRLVTRLPAQSISGSPRSQTPMRIL